MSKNQGKILVVVGPQSSGKTTLVSKIIKAIPSLCTINRKEILFGLVPELDRLFFSELIKEVSEIIGRKIKDHIELFQFKTEDILDEDLRSKVNGLQTQLKSILQSKEFEKSFSSLSYKGFYQKMLEHLNNGANVIIDEASINSNKAYKTFVECCDNYPNIRIILLYDTLEGNAQKCFKRNTEFASIISEYDTTKRISQIIKEIEIKSGGSSSTYRLPKTLIKNYTEYYSLKSQVSSDESVLGVISKEKLRGLIIKMAKEHLKILGLLYYRGDKITKDLVEIEQEVAEIIKDAKLYVVSKMTFDHIIHAEQIPSLASLNNAVLVQQLMQGILGLDNDSTFYNKPSCSTTEKTANKVKKHFITPPILQLESTLTYELGEKHLIIGVQNYNEIAYLSSLANSILATLFSGKTIIIPLLGNDSCDGVVIISQKKDLVQFTYYNFQSNFLELDSQALLLVTLFYFSTQDLKISNIAFEVKDSSRLFKHSPHEDTYGLISLVRYLDDSLGHDPRVEWNIWSKCFGKVLIINGVSSSGKTTLTDHLAKYGFIRVNPDEAREEILIKKFKEAIPNLVTFAEEFLPQHVLCKILLGYKVDSSKYTCSHQQLITTLKNQVKLVTEKVIREFPSEQVIFDLTYQKSQKFIFSGQNIVVDVVLTDDSDVTLFSSCFRGHPITTILLYASLEENLNRCFLRNELSFKNDTFEYRDPAWVIKQYFQFYGHEAEKNDQAIGKVNKENTKLILKKAIDHAQYLYSIYSEQTFGNVEPIKNIQKLIEQATESMNLYIAGDLYVEPKATNTGYPLDNNSADYTELAGFVASHIDDFLLTL